MQIRKAQVITPFGLHARAVGEIVKMCREFACDIRLIYNGTTFNPRKLFELMGAGIRSGSVIELQAEGEDEERAVETLADYINTLTD